MTPLVTTPLLAPRWQLALSIGVLMLAGALLPGSLGVFRWDRAALAEGQWVRLLTAHLVHLSPMHLLSNLLGLAVLSELLLARWRLGALMSLLLCSALGTSLLLWCFEPQLQWYAGLSGVLHGLWGGAALLGWLCSRQTLFGLALLALAVKLAATQAGLMPVTGLPVVGVAHAYGGASGLLWALVCATCPRRNHFD